MEKEIKKEIIEKVMEIINDQIRIYKSSINFNKERIKEYEEGIELFSNTLTKWENVKKELEVD